MAYLPTQISYDTNVWEYRQRGLPYVSLISTRLVSYWIAPAEEQDLCSHIVFSVWNIIIIATYTWNDNISVHIINRQNIHSCSLIYKQGSNEKIVFKENKSESVEFQTQILWGVAVFVQHTHNSTLHHIISK